MLITYSDLSSVPLRKSFNESSSTILRNAAASFQETRIYDIFISHSYSDSDQILKLSTYLEDRGFSTYVDWLRDRELDRSNVNSATAGTLRARMKSCRSLVYVASENAVDSKWMPWELGYFDALKGKVAILPVVAGSHSDEYHGREYLGLYPYVTSGDTRGKKPALWVHESAERYVNMELWLKGEKPERHPSDV